MALLDKRCQSKTKVKACLIFWPILRIGVKPGVGMGIRLVHTVTDIYKTEKCSNATSARSEQRTLHVLSIVHTQIFSFESTQSL